MKAGPLALLILSGCSARHGSHFLIAPAPRSGPVESCPYAPIGSDVYIRVLAVTEHDDTLRTAQVSLRGGGLNGQIMPVTLTAPGEDGVYTFGPVEVGDYRLTVADSGRHPARIRLQFCHNESVSLRAVLVPERR